jgi:hypothetical protein
MAKTCHAQPFVPTEGAVPTEAAGSAAKARNEGIGGLRLTRRQGHKVRANSNEAFGLLAALSFCPSNALPVFTAPKRKHAPVGGA